MSIGGPAGWPQHAVPAHTEGVQGLLRPAAWYLAMGYSHYFSGRRQAACQYERAGRGEGGRLHFACELLLRARPTRPAAGGSFTGNAHKKGRE